MRSWGALAALLALSACSASVPPEAEQPGPAFDPIAFFTGPTRGDGRLDQIMKDERRLAVESVGTPAADGTLALTQRISLQGDPVRTRMWTLRQIAPGRYAGTLTDASGPVETVAIGRAIRIRYAMDGGLAVEQWLVAMPGGWALDNRMTVTKWGVQVATLRERIEKR